MVAYSLDLRTRVIKDSDAGMASKLVAEKYAVSRAWVDRLKQRRREAALVHESGVRLRGGRPDWMDEVESPSHVQDKVPRPELGRL